VVEREADYQICQDLDYFRDIVLQSPCCPSCVIERKGDRFGTRDEIIAFNLQHFLIEVISRERLLSVAVE
jgi:hypothetical protein